VRASDRASGHATVPRPVASGAGDTRPRPAGHHFGGGGRESARHVDAKGPTEVSRRLTGDRTALRSHGERAHERRRPELSERLTPVLIRLNLMLTCCPRPTLCARHRYSCESCLTPLEPMK